MRPRVMLVTDHNSGVDAVVQRTRGRGIVEGTADGRCGLKFVKRTEDLQVGDVVVSSGLDGIFPRGLPIGRIVTVDKQGQGLFQYAQIDARRRHGGARGGAGDVRAPWPPRRRNPRRRAPPAGEACGAPSPFALAGRRRRRPADDGAAAVSVPTWMAPEPPAGAGGLPRRAPLRRRGAAWRVRLWATCSTRSPGRSSGSTPSRSRWSISGSTSSRACCGPRAGCPPS